MTASAKGTPSGPSMRRRLRPVTGFLTVFVLLLVGTALATFLVLMLYQNIVARQAEATKDVFRVVEVDDRTVDPAIWGKNYPRQYDSYRRTVDMERTKFGGSEADPAASDKTTSKTEADPRLKELLDAVMGL